MDKLFEKLIMAFSTSGHEEVIKNIIKHEIDEIDKVYYEDSIGNLYVKIGNGEKTLMLYTSMDKPGFMVTSIDDKGNIFISPLGDFKACNLIGSEVIFENGIIGYVVSNKDNPAFEDVYIDIGAKEKEEVIKLINLGDTCIISRNSINNSEIIGGSGLIEASGCYTLLKILSIVRESPMCIYLVFGAQGQLKGKGAEVAARSINPDYCISLTAYDSSEGCISVGKGPILTIMDRSLMAHEEVKAMIQGSAKKLNIDVQNHVSDRRSEAGIIHMQNVGIKTGILAIACRNINTPSQFVSSKDIEDRITILRGALS